MRNSFFSLAALLLLVCSSSLSVVIAAEYNYREALEKSLLYFEAQRSGKLPTNQRVKWRSDSALQDGFDTGVDLVGGYYDSGDHVKFGLPMAFSVTLLSWSVIKFEKEITAANQLEYALDAIRWGTDYFIKAHPQPNVFWAQVGDGDTDHACWERAEDMSTSRTAYKVDCENPGSEVAGETAAALAAASIVFKSYNSTYSNLLLLHARQLFTFADTFRGRYDNSLRTVRNFYPSADGFNDELLWAAAWLFEATDDKYYLNYVMENAVMLGGTSWSVTEFSWDNKYAGLQIFMTKILIEGGAEDYSSTLLQYKAKAEFFVCACLGKNSDYNVQKTSGGLLYFHDWNNLEYVSAASLLLVLYSEYLRMGKENLNCANGQVSPHEIKSFAQTQADYILGKNPKGMSYLVGFGPYYPTHVHHRGASIPSIFVLPSVVGCTEGFDYFNSPDADPNIIYGALVGGPDENDEYCNERSNYDESEPAICAVAPLIGLFAFFGGSENSGYSPSYIPSYTPSSSSSSPPAEEPSSKGSPVEFWHTITSQWEQDGEEYYHHQVTVKNICGKALTYLELKIENLSGTLYGLSETSTKGIYEFPPWLKVLDAGSQFVFVYIQGGPQATVSVVKYTEADY